MKPEQDLPPHKELLRELGYGLGALFGGASIGAVLAWAYFSVSLVCPR